MKKAFRSAVIALTSGACLLCSSTAGGAVPDDDIADEKITCEQSPGADPFYKKPSASKVYDDMFSKSRAIPGLDDDYVPQGLAVWKDLMLITAYENDDDSEDRGDSEGDRGSGTSARIYVINLTTGARDFVEIADSHAGGIAVVKDWVFVEGKQVDDGEDEGTERDYTIDKYRLDSLLLALSLPGHATLNPVGEPRKVYGSSFLASSGDTLYAGRFNTGGRDSMYEYSVAANGNLKTGQKYEVPKKTQGLLVSKGHFIYSTSHGGGNFSNVYVVDGGATDIDSSARCFRAPSMSQGIAAFNGNAYLLFESGARKYVDGAKNPIRNLHKADLVDLATY